MMAGLFATGAAGVVLILSAPAAASNPPVATGLAPATAGLAPATAGLAPATAGLAPATAGLAPAAAGLAPDDLSVTVSRKGDRIVVGRLTTYRITVDNPGPEPVDVTVHTSTPRQLEELTATGGAISRHGVDWRLTVPAEDAATTTLTGVYAGTGAEGTDHPYRVVLTACILDDEGRPRVCDTDIADLESAGWLAQWWWVAVPLAGVGVWYLRRRRRPYQAPADGEGEELVLDLGLVERRDRNPRGRHRSRLPRPASRSRTR
jgi:hypothetical protein